MTTSIHLRVYFSPVFSYFLRRDPKPPRKELTERTTEYSIFEPVKNRTATGFVRYETHSLNGDFECRTFDHSDNSPCISTVFRALRKCKKNRQERYDILKFELTKTLINQGFSAEKTARANAHFESGPL